jgi:FkbM family methyltransferase
MRGSHRVRRLLETLRDPEGRRVAKEAFLLERVWRRPIVFEDSRGLLFVLYPDENARVYLEHRGNYEIEETAFCERVVKPGAVVADVGANIGLYSVLLARLVGEAGSVHAFEPEANNVRRLRVNLALNDLDNVVVNQCAVFSSSGTQTLNVYRPALGSWHTLGRPKLTDPLRGHAPAEPESAVEVDTVSLDDYAQAQAIDRLDLVKIDVEGAELDVLQGAERMLADGRVDLLLFEVSLPQVEGMAHRPEDVFELLARHGYRSFALPDLAEVSSTNLRYGNYVATRDPDRLAAAR